MKEKKRLEWNAMRPMQKFVAALGIILSIAIIALAILYLFDLLTFAPNLYIPLLGFQLLCQTYLQWNMNRKVAILYLCVAIFIFVCTVAVFFI